MADTTSNDQDVNKIMDDSKKKDGGLNIGLPEKYECDNDVVFKITKPRVKEPKVQNFRSFCITSNYMGIISLGKKSVVMANLIDLLQKNGLSKVLPVKVIFNNKTVINNIDWNPPCYNGPTVWYFKWTIKNVNRQSDNAVSYTHLTLPTILRV